MVKVLSGSRMERRAIEGESPVREKNRSLVLSLSRASHVEPGLNPGGPPPKAKYSSMTDSAK